MKKRSSLVPSMLVFFFLFYYCGPGLIAQDSFTLEVTPNPVQVKVNEVKQLTVVVKDATGQPVKNGETFFLILRKSGAVPTSGAQVSSESGKVTGLIPGEYNMLVAWGNREEGQFAKDYVPVEVSHGPVAKIVINNIPEQIFNGSVIPVEAEVSDDLGFPIEADEIKFSVANTDIAEIDDLHNLYTKKVGSTKLIANVKGLDFSTTINVIKNPVDRIELSVEKVMARTGDVLHFKASAKTTKGKTVEQVPFSFSVSGEESELASGASAIIEQDGRFVAEKPGTYTITASSGDKSAIKTVKISPRNVQKEIEVIGHGVVRDKHTSDFWVWEGIDGRDYAVTGTWGADGKAYFWDVTNPANIQRIDSIQVDARTVNDVKISEDGRICVISREGASNRKNGIVILDVSNPKDVKIHSTYTETLTGGVHNLFIYQNHVFALSNGQRYDIINIEDPTKPHRVGKFEIDNPARSIHDVWIENGIAYSSNWNDGIIMVDIGNGIAGGTPANPVEIARSKVEGDANHAAFPYRSMSTGKFYVIAGDEIFPTSWFGKQNQDMEVFTPAGYLHFIDFTDPQNPKEVARYEVPEAGSHNFWIEDDLLYIGYYNGGVRVVDLSGDLMGDLYQQGREIAHYVPADPKAFVPNFAMIWGAQPYKGHIFFSDFNSGLWSVKLSEGVVD